MGKHMLEINGHKIYCDSDREYYGLKYLKYTMDEAAVQQLFSQVESQREAHFEDEEHRKFTLVDGENGTFTVTRDDKPSGWF